MAAADALCGIGVPPEVAKRVGWRAIALTPTSTTQGTGVIVANNENVIVNLATAGGATACTLPANAAIGDMVFVNNLSATDAVVFPPTGQTIGQASANSSVTVDKGALFIKSGATSWASTDIT